MEANTSNLERLRVIREGHRRYVSKLDQELTEILQAKTRITNGSMLLGNSWMENKIR